MHFLDEEDVIEEVCAHAQDVLSGSNSSRTFEFSVGEAPSKRKEATDASSEQQATLPGAPPPETAKGKARESELARSTAADRY